MFSIVQAGFVERSHIHYGFSFPENRNMHFPFS